MEGPCGSKIERSALHAVHPLRLAQKLQMHRVECPGVATEAWGYACTRSLESALTGFEGRQQAAAPGAATRDSGYSVGG